MYPETSVKPTDQVDFTPGSRQLVEYCKKTLGKSHLEATKIVTYCIEQGCPQNACLTKLVEYVEYAPGMKGLEAMVQLAKFHRWNPGPFEKSMRKIIEEAQQAGKKTSAPPIPRQFYSKWIAPAVLKTDRLETIIADLPERVAEHIQISSQ